MSLINYVNVSKANPPFAYKIQYYVFKMLNTIKVYNFTQLAFNIYNFSHLLFVYIWFNSYHIALSILFFKMYYNQSCSL